jgi:hypothetical protein
MSQKTLQEIKRVTPVVVKDSEGETVDEKELFEMKTKAVERNALQSPAGFVPVKNVETETAPTPLDLKEIESIVASAVKSAVDEVKAATDAEKAELETRNRQLENERDGINSSLAETAEAVRQTNEKLTALETELNESKRIINNFNDLGKLHGSGQPAKEAKNDEVKEQNNAPKFKTVNFNTNISIGYNDKLPGTFREIQHHIDSLPKVLKYTGTKERVIDFDKQELDRYVKQNYRHVLADLNSWGKGAGLFRGTDIQMIDPGESVANTIISDLPGGFLPTLSAIMRVTHRPGFVFHMMPLMRYDFAKSRGNVIQIGRFNYLSVSPTLADYELSAGSTYSAITTRSDSMNTSKVDVQIREYGRGKEDAQTQINPIRIVSFVEYFSAYELAAELNQKFGYDYAQFEDRLIRSRYDVTSVIWYNRGNTITTSATALQNGDGRMSKQFLREMRHRAHSSTSPWEPLPDGNFISVMNSTAWKQLREDLDDDWEVPTPSNLLDFLNAMLPAYVPDESEPRVNGYMGVIEGVHCFESNAFGVGNAGADGVTNVTVRAGSPATTATFRDSYFFGHGAVGRGVAMPVEVRTDSVTNFDRESRLTWLSWEGVDTLDVDPTGSGNSSQQLRVAKFRTTDNALSGLS